MILTEKEATAKWCPFPGISASTGYVIKKDIMDCCVASRCMAWRWQGRRMIGPDRVQCPDCGGGGCDPCDWKGSVLQYEQTGFCGLAGKPE